MIRGIARKVREREMKQVFINRGRYAAVHLCKLGVRRMTYVHRLVALAWHGEPPQAGATVNHCDGNKLNNSSSNLEWVSVQRNIEHAFETGLRSSKGVANPKAKLDEQRVREIRARAAAGESQRAIAASLGVGALCIGRIVRRVTWAHI